MSKTKLSASEWELVKDAPYWVNAAMAAAEGRVSLLTSRRENKALDDAISGYQSSNALVQDIIAEESDPSKELKNATQSSAEKALGKIATTVEQKLGVDDLDALNKFLLDVGKAVASSAGEGVLGLGKKVSKKEAAALDGIAEALMATPAHKRERREARLAEKKAETTARAEARATAKADREAAAEARAKARAEKQAKAEAERKARAEAREKERAAKAKQSAETEARKKAEQLKRDAEKRSRETAQVKQKAAREAEAKEKVAAEAARKAQEAAAAEAAKYLAEHTVVSGDNLSMISQKYYGTQVNWRHIYEENKEVIGDNPSLIYPGQILRIPRLDS